MMLKRAALLALTLSVAGGGLLLQSATQAERVRAMDQALQDAAGQIMKHGMRPDVVSLGNHDARAEQRDDYNSHEQMRAAFNTEVEALRFGPGGTGRMTLRPSAAIQVDYTRRLESSLTDSLRLLEGGKIEQHILKRRKPDGSTESYLETEEEARDRVIASIRYSSFDPFGRPRIMSTELALNPGTGESSPPLIGKLEIDAPRSWTLWAEYPPETLASASAAQFITLVRNPVPAMLFGLLCAGLMYVALRPARNQRSTHGDIDLLSHAGQQAPADTLGRLLSLDRENTILRRQMLDQGEQLKQLTEGFIQRRESRQQPATDNSPA